jgi:hypothetical protein
MALEKIHEWAMAAAIFNTAYWRQSVGKAADASARDNAAHSEWRRKLLRVWCGGGSSVCVVCCVLRVSWGCVVVGDDGLLPKQEGRRVQPP